MTRKLLVPLALLAALCFSQTTVLGATQAAPLSLSEQISSQFPLAARLLERDKGMPARALTVSGATLPADDFSAAVNVAGGSARVFLRPVTLQHSPAVAEQSGTAFRDAFRGIDALRVASGSEALLIREAGARTNVAYDLLPATGIAALGEGRGIRFFSNGRSTGAALSAPLVIDSRGRPSALAHWTIRQGSEGQRLQLVIEDRKLTYPVVAVYSAGIAPGAAAGTASAKSSRSPLRTEALGSGSLSGRVTDSGTGLGIGDIFLFIYDSAGNYVTFGQTDSAGFYSSFDGLDTGTYYVFAPAYGYQAEVYNNIPCNGCDPATTGTGISVTDGVNTPSIDFALASTTAHITGTVTTTAAVPVAGIDVVAYDGSGNGLAVSNTDGSGHFDLTLFSGGTLYVGTANNIYAGYVDQLYSGHDCTGCAVTTGTPVNITLGTTTASINFSLKTNGGAITGHVSDANTSAPIAFQSVSIYNAAGVVVDAVTTDGAGNYSSFRGLNAGNYFVRADAADYDSELYNNISCNGCNVTTGTAVGVTIGNTHAGVNFTLNSSVARVSGRVTDFSTSAPLRDVQVTFYAADGSAVVAAFSDPATGDYSVVLPGAGRYYAKATNDIFAGYIDQLNNSIDCSGCDPTTGTPIDVVVGTPITNVNFAMKHDGGSITGQVLDAVSNHAVPFAQVRIYGSSGQLASYGFSDNAGNYTTFRGLAGGSYYAVAQASGFRDLLYLNHACPPSGCDPTTGTAIPVVRGVATANIDFALGSDFARVTGRVADAGNSVPLGDVTVIFYDASGNVVTSVSSDTSYGTYDVSLSTTGTYYARTQNSSHPGYANQLYDHKPCSGACDPLAGTPINAVEGSVVSNVDFFLTSTSCTGIDLQPATLADGTEGTFYSQTIAVVGGTDPVTFEVSAGALPDGLGLDPSSGVIAGTPTVPGPFNFTIHVIDGSGCQTQRTYDVTIASNAVATTTTLTASPSSLTYGQSTTLTATVSPSGATGSVTFNDGATTVGSASLSGGSASITVSPSAGTHIYTATYGGATGYAPSTSPGATVTVAKATPVITWSTPAAITYGTALSGTQLNATANVAGSFAYTPGSGTILDAGAQTLSTTFTPADTANYNTAAASVTLTVNKANQTISWSTPAAITYGTALSGTQLNATVSVSGPSPAGALTYAPPAGTILNAGSQTLTVTAAATTNYNQATGSVTLTVNKANQTINWSNPANIPYGTPLSSTQLNATVTVPGPSAAGALTYTPPAGTVLSVGSHALSVTAAATSNYNQATAQVTITVIKGTPVFSNLSAPTIEVNTLFTTISGHIAAGAVIPPGNVTVTLAGFPLPAAIQANGDFSATFLTALLFPVSGGYPITFSYAGNANFNAASASSVLTVVFDTEGGAQNPSVHAGTTITFKISLTNAFGFNVSNSLTDVTAYGISHNGGVTWQPAVAASNGSQTFRFVPGEDDNYRFNLKTTGLATGNWILGFKAEGDPTIHTAPFSIH
jgi:hypothetical protein